MLIKFDKLKNSNSYKSNKQKKSLFLKEIIKLNNYHKKNSKLYANIIKIRNNYKINNIEEIPFLPTRLFKNISLKTITNKNIFKILESSGTSGNVSKIFLDKNNASSQIKVLVKIFKDFFYIGNRMPMIIFDKRKIKNQNFKHSAREAAYTGFSFIGNEYFFLLDENEHVKIEELKDFIKKNKDKRIFLFGLTSVIWESLKKLGHIKLNLKNSLLIHGGGWKKIKDQNANKKNFNKLIKEKLNLFDIHDYYGMVEQTGSIFFECEKGYFHTSFFSDIIIRDKFFKKQKIKKKGLIQIISLIPTSYPGHSIITEDQGALFGEDNCKCGRSGKYFKVFGRIPKSEIRGCGNIDDY